MTGWLVDTLIATTGLMVLVLLLREPVRRYFGARTAYALWLLPAGRALMPTLTDTVVRVVPEPTPLVSQPFAPVVSTEPTLMASVSAPPTLIDAMGGWPTIATFLWVGVAIAFLIRGLADFREQRRTILSRSVQLAKLGQIRLVRSPDVRGPMAFGLIDRVIAVPSDFEHRYDERERSLALDHELAHHRHGDLFANLFAFVLLSLQWFNPLAWWSYAAFRFDQEAACDARVLDMAMPRDRADYGRAIAKAASGRALLLASALDHKKTLHRRLKSMLTNPTRGRRLVGTAAIVSALAVVLPLTATRAIDYVDVNAPPAPSAPKGPVVPLAPVAPAIPMAAAVTAPAPVGPLPPEPPAPPLPPSVDKEQRVIVIDGKKMEWKDLTAEQKAKIRADIARARDELSKSKLDRAQMEREMRQALAEAKIDKVEMRREMEDARREIDDAMREIDANAAELRKHGQDPEAIKASVRAAMKSIESIDIERITRDAMAKAQPEAIEAGMRAMDEGLRKAQAEIDRVQAQLDDK